MGRSLISRLDDQVIAVLDAICNQGCDYVDSCIEILTAGGNPPQIAGLSVRQRRHLLEELQAIMSVYHVRKR